MEIESESVTTVRPNIAKEVGKTANGQRLYKRRPFQDDDLENLQVYEFDDPYVAGEKLREITLRFGRLMNQCEEYAKECKNCRDDMVKARRGLARKVADEMIKRMCKK